MHQIKQKQQWQGSLQAVYMKAVTNNIHALTCSHTCSALSMVSSCKNLTSGAIRRFMLVAICFLTYPCSFLSPEIAIVLPSSSLNIDKYTLAMVRSPDTLTSVTLAIADTAESMPIRFSGQTAFCNTCNTHAVWSQALQGRQARAQTGKRNSGRIQHLVCQQQVSNFPLDLLGNFGLSSGIGLQQQLIRKLQLNRGVSSSTSISLTMHLTGMFLVAILMPVYAARMSVHDQPHSALSELWTTRLRTDQRFGLH